MNQLPEMAVVTAGLERQTEAQGAIAIELDRFTAFCVIGQIQIASCHAANMGRLLDVVCQLATELATELPESAQQVGGKWSKPQDGLACSSWEHEPPHYAAYMAPRREFRLPFFLLPRRLFLAYRHRLFNDSLVRSSPTVATVTGETLASEVNTDFDQLKRCVTAVLIETFAGRGAICGEHPSVAQFADLSRENGIAFGLDAVDYRAYNHSVWGGSERQREASEGSPIDNPISVFYGQRSWRSTVWPVLAVVAIDEGSAKFLLHNDIDGFEFAPGDGAKVLATTCRPKEGTMKHFVGLAHFFSGWAVRQCQFHLPRCRTAWVPCLGVQRG